MDSRPIRIGKFELIELLGRGGMAEVYRARQFGEQKFEKEVAIKKVLPEHLSDPAWLSMFEQEARLTSCLNHPNIVHVYDFIRVQNNYLLVMEYIDGTSLSRVLQLLQKQGSCLPIDIALFIANEIFKGLDYAHHRRDPRTDTPLNIIHRDLSPHNIMLSFEGAVKIVDFGIAKAVSNQTHTATGLVRGKIPYMSPEQARCKNIDHRSDIFVACSLLTELITNKCLFSGDSEYDTLTLVAEGLIPDISAIEPKIPNELQPLILRGLAVDPAERFQQIGEAQTFLQEYLSINYPKMNGKIFAEWLRENFQTETLRLRKELNKKHPLPSVSISIPPALPTVLERTEVEAPRSLGKEVIFFMVTAFLLAAGILHMQLKKKLNQRELANTPPASVSASYADLVKQSHPAAYWRFEGSGDKAVDYSDNKKHTAQMIGGYQLGQTGALRNEDSKAVYLDGTSGSAQIPDSLLLKPAKLTVEAWVKINGLQNLKTCGDAPKDFQYLVFKRNSQVGKYEGYTLNLFRGHPCITVTSDFEHQTNACSDQALVSGVWYHIVGTFERPSLRLYVNGQLKGEKTHDFPLDYGIRPIFLGRSGECGGPGEMNFDAYLNGSLAEIAIYPEALSASTISSHYATATTFKN